MAKIVIFNQVDPAIGITLEEADLERALPGVVGTCTECGKPMHWWTEEKAIKAAQAHVDSHEPVLIGGDQDSLIR